MLATERLETFLIALKRYDPFVVYGKMTEGSVAVAIFYDVGDERHVETAVTKLEGIEIPKEYFRQRAAERVAEERERLDAAWHALKRERGERLANAYAQLKHLAEIFNVQSALRKGEEGYLLGGWIPEKEAAAFERALQGSKIRFSPAGDDAPVLLKTPALLRSFETLIRGYSCPAYNEINPTVPFAFAFLVMFGAMFGDVGHGLVLMAAGAMVGKLWPNYRDMGNIYLLAGGGSVLFGFFYGSFFGFHHLIPHLFFSPVERVDLSIYTGIAIGIFFITLSFLINIFSLAKRREFSALLFGEGGVLWLLIYWLAIGIAVKALVFKLPVTVEIAILGGMVALLFLILLIRTKMVVESLLDTLIRMFEHAVNTISFARLGAFALAHGVLFLALFSVADILAHADMRSPGYWFIIVLGNCFIIVLEGVVVTIQTLRLEYYEFFKRFFRGGGTPYNPYRLEGNR
jgi:V/A-type H+-transporting ATPase subunit I